MVYKHAYLDTLQKSAQTGDPKHTTIYLRSMHFMGCSYFHKTLGNIPLLFLLFKAINEPVHEISNNVVCATSKASDQSVHMRSLIRAFASRLSII